MTPHDSGSLPTSAAVGPLTISRTNPRYFAANVDGDERLVYLTGSHVWNTLQDGVGPGARCAEKTEVNDFGAYLQFLQNHNHNFIRLWRWELFKSQASAGAFHLCMSPQPWPRSGHGAAKDGRPKFDLAKFDPAYFDRLRERVIAAGNAGIYVAVMLFDGWGLHLSPPPDNVEGHPFHAANNVNDVSIESILDYQVLPLDDRVRQLQEAYIRKVVDTVHDLPNVLYEVANESSGGGRVDEEFIKYLGMTEIPDWGDSTTWQYWVIDCVKSYEKSRGYQTHPIGMTMQFPVADQTRVNDPLYASRAEWISPGYDDEIFANGGHPMAPGSPPSRWMVDPPPADGRKIVITDTDHYAPGQGDALWAWKSFLRGHHPILMDFGIVDVVNPLDPSTGAPSYDSYEPARYAMGDTLRFARRLDLRTTIPHGELTSTGFALANPGEEYLVLQPAGGTDAFTVELSPGSYAVEWFDVNTRQPKTLGIRPVEKPGRVNFSSPFREGGPALLYLRRQ